MDVTCFRIFALIIGPKLRPNIAFCVGRGLGPSSGKELHFVLGVGWAQTLARLYVLRANGRTHDFNRGTYNCKLRTPAKAGDGAPLHCTTRLVLAARLLANVAMWLRTVSDIAKCPRLG